MWITKRAIEFWGIRNKWPLLVSSPKVLRRSDEERRREEKRLQKTSKCPKKNQIWKARRDPFRSSRYTVQTMTQGVVKDSLDKRFRWCCVAYTNNQHVAQTGTQRQ